MISRALAALIVLFSWTHPSAAQSTSDLRVTEAAQARDAYWRAVDAEDHVSAYAMLATTMQEMLSAEQSAQLQALTTSQMGRAVERRVMRTTVYDNPRNAPAPGLYVAFDFVGRFERADRNCGYIILHRPVEGAPFLVTRTDQTFLSNAEAAASSQPPDVVWAQIAGATCPGWQPSWSIQPPV